jgi:malonyl-CoA decarboxylase
MQKLLGRIAEQGRQLVGPTRYAETESQSIESLCRALLSERGEASGVALACQTHEAYRALDADQRAEFFQALSSDFGPNHAEIKRAVACYEKEASDANAILLHAAAEPRRQELFRRLNRAPYGTAQLVSMREDLLPLLKTRPELAQVDHDFHHLLSSWFNPGFLVLERIDWSSPAVILEKIIRYEAVHAIQSWDDLRRRIDPPDRRCYAFFHPTLVDEPLIFVEVALTNSIPGAIQPILSEDRPHVIPASASTAVFYSISNCQKGLRGVSFGNFLIKGVVEELKRDLPQLETFVTLSPVPTLRRWFSDCRDERSEPLLSSEQLSVIKELDQPDWFERPDAVARLEATLMPLAAHLFLNVKGEHGSTDPVARFHLGNGARLERINWLGDVSERGMRQSAGIMVNYLYDLKHIEENHELFVKQRTVVASDAVKRLLSTVKKNGSPCGDRQEKNAGHEQQWRKK